jgi:hypothetical protein
VIRTTNCQTTLCAFFGCWLTPLRRILVSLSHHLKTSPIPRLAPLPSAQEGSSFSRLRVWVGATVAKAAAARFMPDSAGDGLPLSVSQWFGTSQQHLNLPLPTISLYAFSKVYALYPLYHKACQCVACVSVCMHVFCDNFCSVCVCVCVCVCVQ